MLAKMLVYNFEENHDGVLARAWATKEDLWRSEWRLNMSLGPTKIDFAIENEKSKKIADLGSRGSGGSFLL